MNRLAWAVLLAAASGAWSGEVSFQRVGLGGDAQNGVFAEDLDGDGVRDLIALSRGRIAIYRGRRGQAAAYPETPEVLLTGSAGFFADVADVLPAQGKEVLILTPVGVAAYVHDNGRYAARPVRLLTCETLLATRPLRGAVSTMVFANVNVLPWNFAFDANGDGRDDVLVPHGMGTDVYLQKQPGQFADPITLPVYPFIDHDAMMRGRADYLGSHKAQRVSVQLIIRQLERKDVNGDGKPDLVCGGYCFHQRPDGGFEPIPQPTPSAMRAVVDPLQPNQAVDLNGDGRKDRIEVEHAQDDPLHVITRVRYFLANPDGGLPGAATGVIAAPNIPVHTFVPLHDFNGDGALDFATFKTDLSITDIGKWIRQSFGKIDGRLNLYLFDKAEDRYPRRPVAHKDIRIRFKVGLMEALRGVVWLRYLGTMMRFEGDFNADGRVDLLVREEDTTLALYFNVGGDGIFSDEPSHVFTDTPMFGGLDLDDLNGDGATDLILYGGFEPYGEVTLYNQVIAVYISQLR